MRRVLTGSMRTFHSSFFKVTRLRFWRERTVIERQPEGLAGASNGVARLHIVPQCDELIAGRATHTVGKRRGPVACLFANAERVPRAVRAL